MTGHCNNLMKHVEAKIGNAKQPLFDIKDPDRIYYSYFGDTEDADKTLLPYGEEIQDQNDVVVNKSYIESLDNCIGYKVVVTGEYYIPVLAQVKHRKQDALGNPIGEEHINPIPDTRIYELEFLNGRVDEYTVNIIVENLIDQFDDQGWDTVILEDIVAFCADKDVAIPTGEK